MLGLNIGAGPSFNKNNWHNLDFTGNAYGKDNKYIPHVDINLNLLKKIPKDDETYEYIYTSHIVEHLVNESVEHMLSESYRLLKPNGLIRITCPDYDKYLNKYLKRIHILANTGQTNFERFLHKTFSFCQINGLPKDENALEYNDRVSEEMFNNLLNTKGKNYVFNYCYEISKKYNLVYADKYSGNHINWWNREKLTKYLKNAGFSNIIVFPNNKSYTTNMIGSQFNKTDVENSIYIEAVKT